MASGPQCGPIDALVLRPSDRNSLLDTIFVSRRSRRAVYATTTRGPETSLWRVASSGSLTQVAQINWEHQVLGATAGDGSLRGSQSSSRTEMVILGGKMTRVDEFLRKGRGWFPSNSRLLTIGDVEYKWKPGSESSGIHETRPKNRKGSYHDVWKIWSCVATQGPTTSSSNQGGLPNYSLSNATNGAHATAASHLEANGVYSPMLSAAASINSLESIAMQHLPSNIASIKVIISLILTAPAPPTVLARFAPPQPGLPYNEITLFPRILDSPDSSDALFTLEQLLTSAILLATTKGEWKRVQSLNGPPALQEILTAEATGQVPPYTPTFGRTLERGPGQANGGRGQRNRADSSPARRTIQYRGVESYSENDSENAPLLSQRSSNHQATPSSAHWFSSSGSSSAQRTDLRKPSRSALPAGAMYSRSRESQANDGILTGPHRSLQSRYPTDARITPILGSHTNDAEPRRPTTGPPPIYRA